MNQRHALAYVFLPIIQREFDTFADLWNSHRIRSQNNLEPPNGVANHMFPFHNSTVEHEKAFQSQLTSCRKHPLNLDSALTMEVLYMTSWMKNS